MEEKKTNDSMLVHKLLEKSQEAFIMGIEIYNKPTIKYRVEGFSFFVCNAWELLLKAYIMSKDGEGAIYYKDNERTLSLEACIKKVFTNNKDPLRKNLERISKLRNQSTHFVTEEYETLYVGLFQSNVQNYSNKLMAFFNIDITEKIALNFLTLNVRLSDTGSEQEFSAKYSSKMANHFFRLKSEIHDEAQIDRPEYSSIILHQHYITKNPSEAATSFRITKDSDEAIQIVQKVLDINNTHPYNAKKCINKIKDRIKRSKIDFDLNSFNMSTFQLFVKYYDIKSDPQKCFVNKTTTMPTYTYSERAIDFIVGEIQRNPKEIVNHLRANLKNKS